MPPDKPFQLSRRNARREDGLSSSLQVAKAAEHLACAELLMQGWNAVLADAGLPYDLLVDIGGGQFCRVQVKATTRMYSRPVGKPGKKHKGLHPAYRFPLRRSRTGDRRITLDACDHLALVALDRRLVAWLPVALLRLASGHVKMLIEMKTRAVEYVRAGPCGTDPAKSGRFMEDFAVFNPEGADVCLASENGREGVVAVEEYYPEG